jgi:hypothetical protein
VSSLEEQAIAEAHRRGLIRTPEEERELAEWREQRKAEEARLIAEIRQLLQEFADLARKYESKQVYLYERRSPPLPIGRDATYSEATDSRGSCTRVAWLLRNARMDTSDQDGREGIVGIAVTDDGQPVSFTSGYRYSNAHARRWEETYYELGTEPTLSTTPSQYWGDNEITKEAILAVSAAIIARSSKRT